jgi:DnaJ-class molecular chaperone
LNYIQRYIFLAILVTLGWQIPYHSMAQSSIGGAGRLMTLALVEMEKGRFDKANDYFRQIIDGELNIPREMPYYFAKTLYELEQYDNSNNFLEKYLQINGYRGDNYEAAIQLQNQLKKPLEEIKNCEYCDIRGYEYVVCEICKGEQQIHQTCNYCKGKGIVGCSRCAGKGIVSKKNVFNIIEYFECERCSGNGRLTCPECEGKKSIEADCNTCQGMGKLIGEQICNHQPNNKPRHLSTKFQKLMESNPHP